MLHHEDTKFFDSRRLSRLSRYFAWLLHKKIQINLLNLREKISREVAKAQSFLALADFAD